MSGSDSEVVLRPVRIGAGSFAAAYVPRHGRVAYKEVHDSKLADVLLAEYQFLARLNRTWNGDSFFSIPRAFAYSDGETFTAEEASAGPRIRARAFEPFTRATYAMDYVSPLPHTSGTHLGASYFPAGLEQGPTLCRLYFGKVYETTRPKFVNTSNFPLDEARYARLRAVDDELPTAEEVARGMGDTLARLHFLARVDARDVEFVLGGDGYDGHTFYIIDFNQIRPFDVTAASVEPLVSAFFANDPYYPRPRSSNQLYTEFKNAYLAACPSDAQGLDVAFIRSIETNQAERDAKHTTLELA